MPRAFHIECFDCQSCLLHAEVEGVASGGSAFLVCGSGLLVVGCRLSVADGYGRLWVVGSGLLGRWRITFRIVEKFVRKIKDVVAWRSEEHSGDVLGAFVEFHA